MSLQPCLPLPSRSSNRGGRKRPRDGRSGCACSGRRHRQSGDHDRGNDESESTTASSPPHAETIREMVSGKQKIADLVGLSALEFIGLVHEESQRLGDVFVADGFGACDFGGGRGDQMLLVQEQDEPEEEGEIAGTTKEDVLEKNTTASSHTSDAEGVHITSSRPKETFQSHIGISGSLAYLLSARTDLPRPPSAAHLPTSAPALASTSASSSLIANSASACSWANSTIDDFSKLRLYLDACVEGDVGGKQSGMRMPVPPMRARDAWHLYCLGKDEAQGYYQDDDVGGNGDGDLEIDKANSSKVEPWMVHIPAAGHPPSTALLCQMDQVMIRRVLSHHISYVCGSDDDDDDDDHARRSYHTPYAMTANRAIWLYGLLARLAKPLHRDDAAALRQLLRECCVRRARARADAMSGEIKLLNTLAAVVGIYFEQGTSDALFSL